MNTFTNLDEEFREERVASIFERPPVLALHELRSVIVHISHVHKHGRSGGAVTAVTRLHRQREAGQRQGRLGDEGTRVRILLVAAFYSSG